MAQQTRTFNTQLEARTWAAMIEREMDAGVFVSPSEAEATSFANALELYAKEITCNKRSSASAVTHPGYATPPISPQITCEHPCAY